MKKTLLILCALVMLAATGVSAQVGINANNELPDSSAMLDVKSVDKGILVPRMSATQRDAIANPATGLLVFVNTDSSFYYFGGTAWLQLTGGTISALTDADNDTKIQVEESADEDIIRFDLNGTEGMVITQNPDGDTRLEFPNNVDNTLIGNNAGAAITWGYENTFVGAEAGAATTTGGYNTFLGYESGVSNTSGGDNTFLGYFTGYETRTGHDNTFVGYEAGYLNETGSNNVYLGYEAGSQNVSGNRNVFLGYRAGKDELGSNKLYIENTSADSTVALIYGEFDNDLLRINGTLNINGAFELPTADGTSGQLLQTDGNGTLTWTNVSGFNSVDNVTDTDGDTRIQVEESADEDIIRFDTDNTERMVIDNNGNVGIGTDTPAEKLHVQVEGTTGLNLPLFAQNTTATDTGGIAVGIGFANQNANAPFPKAAIVHERNANWGIGDMHFVLHDQPNNDSLTLSAAKMTLTHAGNLGVGTVTPSDELHVEGSIRMVDGNQQAGYIPVADANGKMIWTDPTTISTAEDADADPTNELQTLSQSGSDVTLSDGGGTISVEDADADTTNELQTLSISGNDITLSDGGGTVSVPIQTELADADNDTKIQVEESADEDIIRFGIAGSEVWRMEGNRLIPNNAGKGVFIGENAGANDTLYIGGSPTYNSFIGHEVGASNVTGVRNVAVGAFTLSENIAGDYNVVLGDQALYQGEGSKNVAIGGNVIRTGDAVESNIGVGYNALRLLKNGDYNVALGEQAGNGNVPHDKTGSTYLGYQAGYLNMGDHNVFIGHKAGSNSYWQNLDNRLVIANDAGSANNVLIYGEFDNEIVGINGKLGVGTHTPSDQLHVEGSIRMVDGNEAAGYIPVADANGTMVWTDPATIQTDTLSVIADADSDTKIQVEESADEDIIRFDTDGTERMVIRNNGKIGLGQSTPAWHTTVRSDENIFSAGDTIDPTKFAFTVVNGAATNSEGVGIGLGKSNNGGQAGAGIVFKKTGDNSTGKLMLTVKSDFSTNGSQIPALTIRPISGNVGIGTATPDDQLHVEGAIRMVDGNETAGYIPVSDANGTMVWTDPTTITTAEDADADITNELQTLSQTGSDVTLSDGGGTISVEDADADPANELQTLFQSGSDVTLSDGGGTISVEDADADTTNELQTLSISGNDITLSDGGGTVSVPIQTELADADNDTKIQVEESGDEDIIRFDVAGSQALTISSNANGRARLLFTNANSGITINGGFNLSSGSDNILLGVNSGNTLTTGSNNLFLGTRAGFTTNGSGNVFLGYEAGRFETGSNMLYIDNTDSSTPLIYGEFDNDLVGINGNLGVGTDAPDVTLHVSASTTGDATGIKLTQGSANSLIYHDGSNNLVIRKAAETDQLVLDGDGEVGVGTNAPDSKFHVVDDFTSVGRFVATVENTGNGEYANGLRIKAGQNTQSVNNRFISFVKPNGNEIGAIRQITTSSVDYNTTSDERLKTNITPTSKGLQDLMKIEVKDYVYKEDLDKPQTGFIAQQVYEHYPNAVSPGTDVKTNPWMMDYGKMTPLLVKAVQDLTKVVEEKNAENKALQEQVSELMQRMEQLEQQHKALKVLETTASQK